MFQIYIKNLRIFFLDETLKQKNEKNVGYQNAMQMKNMIKFMVLLWCIIIWIKLLKKNKNMTHHFKPCKKLEPLHNS